ncbi:MAG: hypothetical protein VB036_11245, partial [Propionicimonas sp.]|nr:hypothetical protein [Propionicimonas sp.]
ARSIHSEFVPDSWATVTVPEMSPPLDDAEDAGVVEVAGGACVVHPVSRVVAASRAMPALTAGWALFIE